MSPFTKYAYLAVQPFLDDAGTDTVELLAEDFTRFGVNPELVREVWACQNDNGTGLLYFWVNTIISYQLL